MGVLNCGTRSCDQIMCRYRIDGDYICEDCLETLRKIPAYSLLQAQSNLDQLRSGIIHNSDLGLMEKWVENNLEDIYEYEEE